MVTLQGELVTQEQKITELNKLLQDALLTSQSVRKELTDEITRISEQSNTALYNAAKKYAEEKEALQTEMEVYRTQVSATFTVHCICMYTVVTCVKSFKHSIRCLK